MYFQQEDIETITIQTVEELKQTKLGIAIPVLSGFKARGFPIVGTNLDYFDFRDLHVILGRNLTYVGECLVGSNVATRLNLAPGDSLISSPEKPCPF